MKLRDPDPHWLNNAARAADFSPYGHRVDLVPAAAIIPEPIHWLWYGWLAKGKMHIIAGAPGTGKTTWALTMAAITSNGTIGGQSWPDGTYAPIGNVIVWSGEDGVEDVIVPRLIAAGANMDRVFIIRGTQEHGRSRAFDFQTDLPGLIDEIVKIGSVSLIIVDSIVQAVSGNSHKNAEVRRSLEPLVNLAEQHGCAILGVAHLNKGSKGKPPTDRVNGSVAFVAVSRLVMCTAKIQASSSPEVPDSYVLVRVKSNLGPDDGGFEYGIEATEFQVGAATIQTSRIGSDYLALQGSGKDLLHWAETGDMPLDTSAVAQAAAFLQHILSNGEVPYPEIERLALEAGISRASLKRAKALLGIKSRKQTGKGGNPSLWRPPGNSTLCEFQSQGGAITPRSVFAQFGQSRSPSPVGPEQTAWTAPVAPVAPVAPPEHLASDGPVAPPAPLGHHLSPMTVGRLDSNGTQSTDQSERTLNDLVETHFGHTESIERTTSEGDQSETKLNHMNGQDFDATERIPIIADVLKYLANRCRSSLNAAKMEEDDFEDIAARIVAEEVDAVVPDENEKAAYRSALQQLAWWNAQPPAASR